MPQTLLEFRTARVKCARFHPRRQWVLLSQHDGFVEIWDWNIACRVDRFLAHNASVRAAAFHSTEAIFATAGDDKVIKLWNLENRKMIAALAGHTDYIRSLDFSNNLQPWICSASDDGTIRIWNWQSRKCVAIAVGHQGFVMCAKFHPSDLLMCSASMDGSVRVWDLLPIIKQAGQKQSLLQSLTQQYLNMPGCILSYSVNGQSHSRGVNWVSWGKDNVIYSSADDNTVKQWRLNKFRSSSLESLSEDALLLCIHTFTQHRNNVNCVEVGIDNIFVSASSDGTISVHELSTKKYVGHLRASDLKRYVPVGAGQDVWKHFSNDHGENAPKQSSSGQAPRFWCVSQHPTEALWAVGHDDGFAVLKFVDYALLASHKLFFIKKHKLFSIKKDGNQVEEKQICEIQKRAVPKGSFGAGLVVAQADELFVLGNPYPIILGYSEYGFLDVITPNAVNTISGNCGTEGNGKFVYYDLNNEVLMICKANAGGLAEEANIKVLGKPSALLVASGKIWAAVNGVFKSISDLGFQQLPESDNNNLNNEKACVLGFSPRKMLPSPSGTLVAAVGQTHVALVDISEETPKILAKMRTATPTTSFVFSSLKPGTEAVFGEKETLVYATRTHVCYLTKNKASGALTSINRPVTLLQAQNQQLLYVDDRGSPICTDFDAVSAGLLTAAAEGRFGDVRRQLPRASRQSHGIALVAELLRSGAPKVALQLLNTEQKALRSSLAIRLGFLDQLPIDSLKDEVNPELFEEALLQGRGMTAFRAGNSEQQAFIASLYDAEVQLSPEKLAKSNVQEKINTALLQFDDQLLCNTLTEAGALGAAYVLAQRAGISLGDVPGLKEAADLAKNDDQAAQFSLKHVSQAKMLNFKKRSGKIRDWKVRKVEEVEEEPVTIDSNEQKAEIHVVQEWDVNESTEDTEKAPGNAQEQNNGNWDNFSDTTDYSDTSDSSEEYNKQQNKALELVTPGSQLLKSAGFSADSDILNDYLDQIRNAYKQNKCLNYTFNDLKSVDAEIIGKFKQREMEDAYNDYIMLLARLKLLYCEEQMKGQLTQNKAYKKDLEDKIKHSLDYLRICYCDRLLTQDKNNPYNGHYALEMATCQPLPEIRVQILGQAFTHLKTINTEQTQMIINEIEKICNDKKIAMSDGLRKKINKFSSQGRISNDEDVAKIRSLKEVCFDYGINKLAQKVPTYQCTFCNSYSSKPGVCQMCQLGDWL